MLKITDLEALSPLVAGTYEYSFEFQVKGPSVTTDIAKTDVICRLVENNIVV